MVSEYSKYKVDALVQVHTHGFSKCHSDDISNAVVYLAAYVFDLPNYEFLYIFQILFQRDWTAV